MRQVNRHNLMQPSVHPKTMEPMDGLIELVEAHINRNPAHRPKPLSKKDTDEHGHVDVCMWKYVGDEVLTLEKEFAKILDIVTKLVITDQTILDRCVPDECVSV